MGRWLTLSPAEIDRAGAWFARRGRAAVLVGRLVPGVRTLISVPAGVAGMPLGPFLLTTAFGTLLWTGLLAMAAGNAVLILALGGYGYRVLTFGKPTWEVP
jgi:membrane protein DedA with SNARE-associated domain